MTCTGCMQYFCWICMGSLSRANPYKHFTDPASPCFNRLFHAVDVNGDIWEDEIEDQLTSTAQDMEVEWFALIFCQVYRVTLQDIQGAIGLVFLCRRYGRTRFYFHVVLLIKAHVYIFSLQHN